MWTDNLTPVLRPSPLRLTERGIAERRGEVHSSGVAKARSQLESSFSGQGKHHARSGVIFFSSNKRDFY